MKTKKTTSQSNRDKAAKTDIAQIAHSFRLFVRSSSLLVRSLVKYGSINISDEELKELARDIARPFLALVGKVKEKDK